MVATVHLLGKADATGATEGRFQPGFVSRSDGRQLRYVEDKPLDLGSIACFLAESEQKNHWSNFGPVSERLETEIAKTLRLDDNLRVVMCSSGTAALHAIIALHETLAGRDLRWVTSAFGFYSAIQGPLRNADIVDCDEHAMLDMTQLDPSSFDGFIVTNTFGQCSSLEDYHRYAAAHGKIMCVDAAMAFGSHRHGANEIISFHHTKPWGFGEGGCAIVAAEHESLFRSLICFGHEAGGDINRRATNAKASDVSCAFGLTRVLQMEELGAQYREQYRRLLRIGRQVGLGVLADCDQHPGIPASVPFLAPLPLADFKHDELPTGRYYHPLTAQAPQAFDIFDRIINVPCHPGMSRLSDELLTEALDSFVQRCFT